MTGASPWAESSSSPSTASRPTWPSPHFPSPSGQWPRVPGFSPCRSPSASAPCADSVHRGSALPNWAPAGQVFAINNCSGLYLSTGNDIKDVPGQQIEHYNWMPVEQPSAFTHTIGFTFNRPVRYLTHPLPLLTYGKSTLVMEPAGTGYVRMQIENSGTSINWPLPSGWRIPITADKLHENLSSP